MGAYEEFLNSDRMKQAVAREVENRKRDKGAFDKGVSDLAAIAEAKKKFEKGEGRPDLGLYEEYIEDSLGRKLEDEYFNAKAAQLVAARKDGMPELTPEQERGLGGAFYHKIVDAQASKMIDEEMKNNPKDFSEHKWFDRKVEHYLTKMHLDDIVEKKAAEMTPFEKKRYIVDNFLCIDKKRGLERAVADQDENVRLADPKMRDKMIEMRLDSYEAQARITAMKKEGKTAPHIDDVYAVVRQERKSAEAKTAGTKTAAVVASAVAAKRTR